MLWTWIYVNLNITPMSSIERIHMQTATRKKNATVIHYISSIDYMAENENLATHAHKAHTKNCRIYSAQRRAVSASVTHCTPNEQKKEWHGIYEQSKHMKQPNHLPFNGRTMLCFSSGCPICFLRHFFVILIIRIFDGTILLLSLVECVISIILFMLLVSLFSFMCLSAFSFRWCFFFSLELCICCRFI